MPVFPASKIKDIADLDMLLGEMTLEEKAGQLNQPPNMLALEDADVKAGKIGSVICAFNAYAGNESHERVRAGQTNRLQRIACEEARLPIPILFARDVIHGHRTVAPIPLGQAASFSPELVEEAQAIAAFEATADGIKWAYTPMLDIARDPRWGRIAEGFGEDPYLASRLAEAAVRGLQGTNMADNDRMAACMKHFVGYGAAEGGRDYNTGEISEYTYRNLYLRPFHAAVKAGIATAMSAFIEVAGIPATCHKWILDDILREEWGFDGVVVSDWDGVGEIVHHGCAADHTEAASKALAAGLDIDMATFAYIKHLPELVRAGVISEELVDRAVRRVLLLKYRCGLFENPYTDETLGDKRMFLPENQNKALEFAKRTLVLLKNENETLPLTKPKKLGIFGTLGKATWEMFGTWCLDGQASEVVTISDAIKKEFGSDVEYMESPNPDDAISFARFVDAVIVVVGESPHRGGENNCVTDIGLPAGQLQLLKGLKRMGTPVIAVVVTGRPNDLSWLEANVDAILLAFHPGSMAGQAIAETLSGKNNPSGKLPVTFPRCVGQVPIYYNRKNTGRPLDPYAKGMTRYIDSLDSPLYEFGYGIGYSPINYSNAKLDGWKVSVDVKNEGKYAAEEIVQVYFRDEVASRSRPIKELVKFSRTTLKPGETKTVSFELKAEDLGYYGPQNTWVVEPGWFQVAIGANSLAPMFARFQVDASGAISESQVM